MAKNKIQYKCSKCGTITYKWSGVCECGSWNTIEECISSAAPASMGTRKGLRSGNKPMKLKEVTTTSEDRIKSDIGEFDRVFGGGIVKDSVNVLTAPPGSGKSTLILSIANTIAIKGHKVLYVAGEESETQIKKRAERICENISENLYIIVETSMNRVENHIDEIDADIIVIDSIQTMFLEEVNSRPGLPAQVDECTFKLIELAKNIERKRAVLIIGQMNKQDELSGKRSFEHAVDSVMYLEGDKGEPLRVLKSGKNRFGSTEEVGLFTMDQNGLIPMENPSLYFSTKREKPVIGSALTVTREGVRNIVVEIESLVSKSYFGYPSRKGLGINRDLLEMLVDILEQRGGVPCAESNVNVMITGGIKLTETAIQLAAIMCIYSSYKKIPIPNNTVFIGEVGLTGEVKSVPYIESRVKELERLGFTHVVVPAGTIKEPQNYKINIRQVKTIKDVIEIIN